MVGRLAWQNMIYWNWRKWRGLQTIYKEAQPRRRQNNAAPRQDHHHHHPSFWKILHPMFYVCGSINLIPIPIQSFLCVYYKQQHVVRSQIIPRKQSQYAIISAHLLVDFCIRGHVLSLHIDTWVRLVRVSSDIGGLYSISKKIFYRDDNLTPPPPPPPGQNQNGTDDGPALV